MAYTDAGDIAMPRPARQSDRINLRLNRESKRKLERAAAYSDRTLTDFVIGAALREAETVVREREVITLTADEWQRFQELVLNPPPLNRRLKQAFAEYARVVKR
jgi:uncharacterized protein (DUF1778 family)